MRKNVLIEVIQDGRSPERAKTEKSFGPIPLERTSQPALDFGGTRAVDGQGFAVFGRVVKGMDVVRKIQSGTTNDREQLLTPIAIARIYRK